MNALDNDHAKLPTKQQSQPKALRFVTNYGAPHPKRFAKAPIRFLMSSPDTNKVVDDG